MNQDKAVIFGCNNLGIEVAEILSSKVDNLILVDNREELVKRAMEKGFDATCLDYTDDKELLSLGIGDDISIIFCFFPADHQNVFLTISARSLDPDLLARWELEPTAEVDRQVVLADLIVLRHVGVEVVLPGEDRGADLAVERQPHPDSLLHYRTVEHR